MATTKTTNFDAFVFARMGDFPAAQQSGDLFGPDWTQCAGEIRYKLQAVSTAGGFDEGYALGFAQGPLFCWGFGTMNEMNDVTNGAPFLAPPGGAPAPSPNVTPKQAKALARELAHFQARVQHILGSSEG